MSDLLNIFLIEDQTVDAENIIYALHTTMGLLNKWGLSEQMGFSEIKPEWIRGSNLLKKHGREYYHFQEKDFSDILEKIDEIKEQDSHIGILMDVVLTKEEQEQVDVNDVSKIEFSKRIIDQLDSIYNINIYILLQACVILVPLPGEYSDASICQINIFPKI